MVDNFAWFSVAFANCPVYWRDVKSGPLAFRNYRVAQARSRQARLISETERPEHEANCASFFLLELDKLADS
jgi:hypothetical protein